jgi:hypothetical protein
LLSRDEIFADETVDSLYEKVRAFEQGKTWGSVYKWVLTIRFLGQVFWKTSRWKQPGFWLVG